MRRPLRRRDRTRPLRGLHAKVQPLLGTTKPDVKVGHLLTEVRAKHRHAAGRKQTQLLSVCIEETSLRWGKGRLPLL